MNSLTQFLLECRERLDRATPGPWSVHRFDNEGGYISYQVECEPSENGDIAIAWSSELTNAKYCKRNAELIAHAPTDLDKACKVIELYEQALVTLEVAVNDKVSDPGATAFIQRTREQAAAIVAGGEGNGTR